MRRPCSVTLS